MYTIHSAPKDQKYEHFINCIYCLVRRYDTFFGPNEGTTFHAAATETTFENLRKNFSVGQENFASPFNCYFYRFNSAFPDTDGFFGSRGSFFDFYPTQGSFETGPPYTEEVMEKMVLHIWKLLKEATGPLSFVVFVPNWRTPLARNQAIMEGVETVNNEKFIFTRREILLSGKNYAYVAGDQHKKKVADDPEQRFFVLPFETKLYFIQNDEATQQWEITDQKIENLEHILNDKREVEKIK